VELQRINASLTLALCHHQDLTAKLNRKLFYAQEDLKKSNQHVAALESVLMNQSQQQQQQQYSIQPPNAVFQNPHQPTHHHQFQPPSPFQLATEEEQLMEHRTAGTLLSPSKKGRRPLDSINSNVPLKMSDLPLLPKKKRQQKRAPINSPPAKPSQKKAATGPTPEKMPYRTGVLFYGSDEAEEDQQSKPSATTMSLVQLRNAQWTVSDNQPAPSACRPLLTAIHQHTKGDISILKASVD